MIRRLIRKMSRKVALPFDAFFQMEAASGILLLGCAVLALIIANSSYREGYESVLHTMVAGLSVQHWVNDGLMTIFFFVVGIEIKRELVKGELSTPQKAALPFAAAFGGMLVPALIYAAFNTSVPDVRGWGIPMATDIAFAVGVLALFGKRVPPALKVFLLALAIVDDLGAVLVIAFFYTQTISGAALGVAVLLFLSIFFLQKAGVTAKVYYVIVGALAWFAVQRSGVHATVAGVVIGFLTPSEPVLDEIESPLDELLGSLAPWVTYLIMPLFALANAGVPLLGIRFGELVATGIFKGVFFGLLLGKPLGILGASWLAVKLRLAKLPGDENWRQIFGVGILGGIGFTMSLFIGNLALEAAEVNTAKFAVLTASLCAGILGFTALYWILKNPVDQT